jgi:hypothetical protein
MKALRSLAMAVGGLALTATLSGCVSPLSMGIFTPIPVPPWVADRIEQRLKYTSDNKTPVLPPIPPGYRPLCEDPPDRAEIIRTMPPIARGVPYFYEEFREDFEFTVEKIVDRVDPPRFFPLVGPAQLHHCHWKCTIYYNETVESNYPFPFQVKKRRVEVVYIDKDHLHLCVTGVDAQQAVNRGMTTAGGAAGGR